MIQRKEMSLETDLKLLKLGHEHLAEKVDDMASAVGRLADAMAPLATYVAEHNALSRRVDDVEDRMEKRKEETDPVIRWAHKAMGAITLIGILSGYFIDDLFDTVAKHETRISILESKKK